MANNSNLNKCVALRQQQELETRHECNARMFGIDLDVLAFVVVVFIVVVVANAISSKAPTAEQLTPPNTTKGHGVVIESKSAQPMGDVPNMVVYEDSQCPICEDHEAQYSNAVLQLIDGGRITLEAYTACLLDNQAEQTPNKKSPQCVIMTAVATDAVGKHREYHKMIYENQPREGASCTDQQFRVDSAAKAGVTGDDLTTFQKLYDTKTYVDFVKNSHETMGKAGIGGTPTCVVNDKKINPGNLPSSDPQTVLTAIQSAASGSN